MGSNVHLKDVCSEITVGYVGPMAKEYINEGVPLLRSLNIKPYKLDLADLKFIPIEFHKKIQKSSLNEGDVVIVRTGVPGTACVIPAGFAELNCSDLVIAKPNKNILDPHYLSFYFNSIAKKYVDNQLVGAIQQHFNIGAAKEMNMYLPSITEQRKIANALNALNTKIELNNRINAELEAMAKTIYDYWFVQFDFPDKNGRPYKTSGGIMVWNDELKREIPEGWEVKPIESVTSIMNSGGTPSTKRKDFYNGDIPWYATNELQDDFLIRSNNAITSAALEESSAKLFPIGTILIAIYAAPTVGRLGILTMESAFNQACCGIVANENVISTEYLFLTLLSMRNQFNMIASGTAQKNLGVGQIKKLYILVPSKQENISFKLIVQSIHKKKKNNQIENQKLTELRDWLLPMLMNGQVRVK